MEEPLNRVSYFILSMLTTLTACGPDRDRDDRPAAPASRPSVGSDAALGVDTIARGLEVPWSLAFTPDGRILVTERAGRIRVVNARGVQDSPWVTLPVLARGEAGLMGIALAPDFQSSGNVYVVGTFAAGRSQINRVLRLTEEGGRGIRPTIIVDELPSHRFHAGGALAFGPDGMLYVTTGDAGQPGRAQDPTSLAGKVLRYTPEGAIPADNPSPGSPVWALGLRNVQGLAWHPDTGELLGTEHGPSGLPGEGSRQDDDELNLLVPGGNYGWPEATGFRGQDRFLQPVAVWTPALAPSGLAIYSGAEFPEWRGDVFVTALRTREIRRVILDRGPDGRPEVTRQESLFERDFGRVRAIAQGPDGLLYFTTSNHDGRGSPGRHDDLILRIVRR